MARQMAPRMAWRLAVAAAASLLPAAVAEVPRESYSDKGATLRFTLDREGRVTDCTATPFGDASASVMLDYRPPGNSDCVENHAAEMAAALGQPVASFGAVELRVAMLTEGGSGSPPPTGFSTRRLLMASVMEIARDGTVSACRNTVAVDIGGRKIDFCHDRAKVGEKQFQPAPSDAPRRMNISVEMIGWPQPAG